MFTPKQPTQQTPITLSKNKTLDLSIDLNPPQSLQFTPINYTKKYQTIRTIQTTPRLLNDTPKRQMTPSASRAINHLNLTIQHQLTSNITFINTNSISSQLQLQLPHFIQSYLDQRGIPQLKSKN